jgi:FixJ family two-component response regulator
MLSSGGSLDHKPRRIGFANIVQISQSLRGTGGTLVAFSQMPAAMGGVMKKVLISVVEDDRFLRESMGRLMRSLGYTVDIFSSAADFLTSPRLAETACLIADIHMPAMTGLELYRRLIDTGHAIPTILVTAFPNDADRARALNDGVLCYLGKPVDEDHLIRCVRAALRSAGLPEEES